LSVGGASHVTVDLLRRGLVLCLELGLDVGSSLAILLKNQIEEMKPFVSKTTLGIGCE
jgi:hypothetical protein